jgi:hypothetical protein
MLNAIVGCEQTTEVVKLGSNTCTIELLSGTAGQMLGNTPEVSHDSKFVLFDEL